MASALARLLAPVLSFTTEEIWSHLPKAQAQCPSVHLASWPQAERRYLDVALEAKWEQILRIREDITRALEEARKQKLIGASAEAEVSLYPENEGTALLLREIEPELKKLLIVSGVKAHEAWEAAPVGAGAGSSTLKIAIQKAAGQKCTRCWLYDKSVGQFAEHPLLCQRCHGVIGGGQAAASR